MHGETLKVINFTCPMPVYTFVNELQYQYSVNFSNKFIHTQY